MSTMWEIQKAIYNLIVADTTLMGMIGNRIYDEPLTNNVYPYIVLGNFTEISDNTLDGIGYDSTFTISIYSKPGSEGWYQAKSIYVRLNELLNMKKPSLSVADDLYPNQTTSYPSSITSMTCVIISLDNTASFRTKDKRVIDVRYRIWTEIN